MGFFNFLSSKSSKTDHQLLVDNGIRLVGQGKQNEAIILFNKVLLNDPKNSEATYWKDIAESILSNSNKKIFPPSQITQKEKTDFDFLFEKGRSLVNRGSSNDAIVLFDKILSRDPNNLDASYWKALSLVNLGKLNEALILFDEVLFRDPENSEAVYWKSIVEYALSNQTPKRRLMQIQNCVTTPERIIPVTTPVTNGEKYQQSRPDTFLNKRPVDILSILIKKHGVSIIENPAVFNALLKDYYKGEFKRESRILLTCVEERIPHDIRINKNQIPFTILSGQLIQRLDDCGFSTELAQWAVYTWAEVLGMTK